VLATCERGMGLIGMTLVKADNGPLTAEGSNPSKSTQGEIPKGWHLSAGLAVLCQQYVVNTGDGLQPRPVIPEAKSLVQIRKQWG
jgi:hypothetical protein